MHTNNDSKLLQKDLTHLSFQDLNIAIIGFGRFGSLWAGLLSQITSIKINKILVYDIFISGSFNQDKDSHSIFNSKLQGLDLPSHCSEKIILIDDLSLLNKSKIIFFCVPISKFEQVLIKLTPHINPKSIVCETCSVKEYPLELMNKILPKKQEHIGLHPLFGPDSMPSKLSLVNKNVNNLNIVVCKYHITDNNYILLKDIFSELKLQIHELTAEEHDRLAVYSQGLTHLVGRVLNQMPLVKSVISTKGSRSLLEIIAQTCNDSEELFYDLQKYNRWSKNMHEQLTQALQNTIKKLQKPFNSNDKY